MEINVAVVIDKPIREVFASWSQVERYPEWFDMTVERRKTSVGQLEVGSTYHAVDKLPLGLHVQTTLDITDYQPNELVAARLSEPLNTVWEARFEEINEGTRMTFHAVANVTGILGVFAPLFEGWAKRECQTGLDCFKENIESEES